MLPPSDPASSPPQPHLTLDVAIHAFCQQHPVEPSTQKTYRKTLMRLADRLGADQPLADVGVEQLFDALTDLWGSAAPRTWNRVRSTVLSFLGYAAERGWAVPDRSAAEERIVVRSAPRARRRHLTKLDLVGLLAQIQNRDTALSLRQRLLWSLIIDTRVRATRLLALDVDEVNLEHRSMRVSDLKARRWSEHTNELLKEYIEGRSDGPLFLSDRVYRSRSAHTPWIIEKGGRRLAPDRAQRECRQYARCTLEQLRRAAIAYRATGVDPAILREAALRTSPASSLPTIGNSAIRCADQQRPPRTA